jgi:hypothetical protein
MKMKTFLWLLVIMGGWYALSRWIFPKLGIHG